MALTSYRLFKSSKKKKKKRRGRSDGSGLFGVGVGLVGLSVGLAALNTVNN